MPLFTEPDRKTSRTASVLLIKAAESGKLLNLFKSSYFFDEEIRLVCKANSREMFHRKKRFLYPYAKNPGKLRLLKVFPDFFFKTFLISFLKTFLKRGRRSRLQFGYFTALHTLNLERMESLPACLLHSAHCSLRCLLQPKRQAFPRRNR